MAGALSGEGGSRAGVPIGVRVMVNQGVAAGLPEWRGLRTRRYTCAREQTGRPWVLYDNLTDPFQLRNHVSDPAAGGNLRPLDRELDEWLRRLGDPCLPWDETLRPAGRVQQWNARERYMRTGAPRLIP